MVTALLGAGCGPWITQIPTYWDPPPYTPRVRPPEPPPVAVAAKPVPSPVPDDDEEIAAPVDDRPACTAIYVVGVSRRLLAFDPREKSFSERGRLECPGPGWATPFSMAVAQDGKAHVLFQDHRIYSVDVVDATCTASPFVPDQAGFGLFGMGYAREGDGEALFVAHIPPFGNSKGLARVDMETGELVPIGPFSDNPGREIELTSTRDGLWGYFLNHSGLGGTLVEIQPGSAEVTTAIPLPTGNRASALAVAWWGGDFYIFTSAGSLSTEVTRYSPDKQTVEVVAKLDDTIVGAGVSTCAPDRKRKPTAVAP